MDNNEKKEIKKKINNLELANEGLLAEYRYVIQKKEENYNKMIEREKTKTEYYKTEFEEAVNKMEKLKEENEAIKNSRWWKLRNKLKGIKE